MGWIGGRCVASEPCGTSVIARSAAGDEYCVPAQLATLSNPVESVSPDIHPFLSTTISLDAYTTPS